MEENKQEVDLQGSIVPAFLKGIMIVLYVIFIIPWKIWVRAVDVVAQSLKMGEVTKEMYKKDFPLLHINLFALEASVVITPMLIAIGGLIISLPLFSLGFGAFLASFVSMLALAYFSPVSIALTKEIVLLFLSIAINTKKSADK